MKNDVPAGRGPILAEVLEQTANPGQLTVHTSEVLDDKVSQGVVAGDVDARDLCACDAAGERFACRESVRSAAG